MNLDTIIVRNPFGFTAAIGATGWYGGDPFDRVKAKILTEHNCDVGAYLSALDGHLLSVVAGYWEERRDGAVDAEWYSIILFDRTKT